MSFLQVVERLDLTGLNFLWKLITDCSEETISNLSIDYLLNMSYLCVSPKFKEDGVKLHRDFIGKCFNRLEKILTHSEDAKKAVLEEGCELEVSLFNLTQLI